MQRLGSVRFYEGNMSRPAGWYVRIKQGPFKGPFAFKAQAEKAREREERKIREAERASKARGNPCDDCGFDHDLEPERADEWHVQAAMAREEE